jgi:general secretion pathway protein J
MKPAKPDVFVAGFSLIEALAAVALTATIVIALSTVAGQWLPNWNRGFAGLQRTDLLGIGLERIAQDVSAAEYVMPSADASGPLFDGEATSVTFVRSAIGPDAYPHLEVVRIAESKDDRGQAMIRTRAPFAPRKPGGSAQSFAFEDMVALIRAPLRVSFAYAGPDRVWVASWKGKQRLPEAMRIVVRNATNRVLADSTAVRLKITASGAPRLEAQANAAGAESSSASSPTGPSEPEAQK